MDVYRTQCNEIDESVWWDQIETAEQAYHGERQPAVRQAEAKISMGVKGFKLVTVWITYFKLYRE